MESFITNMRVIKEVEFHLLTDDLEGVSSQLPKSNVARFTLHKIASEAWPLPTLLRYEYIEMFIENVKSEFLMYIDSDMLLHENFDQDFQEILSNKEINFVAHPGFWRNQRNRKNQIKKNSVRDFIRDTFRMARLGALGDWETRRESRAFVPRKFRKTYICGGVWFGPTEKLRILIKELARNTKLDLEEGMIAKWHDESHLNSWYVQQGGNVLNPGYCFDPTYSNLLGLTARIEAVDKGKFTQA